MVSFRFHSRQHSAGRNHALYSSRSLYEAPPQAASASAALEAEHGGLHNPINAAVVTAGLTIAA